VKTCTVFLLPLIYLSLQKKTYIIIIIIKIKSEMFISLKKQLQYERIQLKMKEEFKKKSEYHIYQRLLN
jgi:hypothetical protein